MIYVTKRKMSAGGTSHEHIVEVKWFDPADPSRAEQASSVPSVVKFIKDKGVARVEGPPPADIGVRTSASGREYIQTYADGVWTNNLLSLPLYYN